MKIRKATTTDLPALLELIKQYPDKLMQSHLPRISKFFIAVKDKRIVGCCALEIYSKRLGEIRSLAVAKDEQGKGIATKLIGHCLRLAKRQDVYEILSITSAHELFEKRGFKTFNKERFALLKVLK